MLQICKMGRDTAKDDDTVVCQQFWVASKWKTCVCLSVFGASVHLPGLVFMEPHA